MLGTAIFFREDSTDLTELARTRLLGFVPLAQGKPQKVEIRGHAARPVRGQPASPDPWELSYQRCLHTMRFLAEQGIPLQQMRLSQAGTSEPYTISDVPERMARNSRVEVFLLDEMVEEAMGTWEEREQRFQTPGKVNPAPVVPPAASSAHGGNTYPEPAKAGAGKSH
jgi:chemotaxis protein MotB